MQHYLSSIIFARRRPSLTVILRMQSKSIDGVFHIHAEFFRGKFI